MSLHSKQEQLRQLLHEQQQRIRQSFPAHRASATIALTRAQDWHYLTSQDASHNTLHSTTIYNAYLHPSGWQKALQYCFSNTADPAPASPPPPDSTLAAWAASLLQDCHHLAASEQVLTYCETGFMSMQQGEQKDFYAWIASKKMPTAWRERADLAWWTHALATTHEHEMQELAIEKASLQPQLDTYASQWQTAMPIYSTTPLLDDYYHRLGTLHRKNMACHLLYPTHTQIGDCTIELYRNVLAILIGLALKHLDICKAFVAQHPSYTLQALLAPQHTTAILIDTLAATLRVEHAAIRRVIDAYTLSHDNASYHCSVANTPAPPLLRLNEQHLTWSLMGLLSEPFFFLTHELKRRYSYEYHTASQQREEVFRHDLYQLFSDKRFIKSTGSIELRGVQGDLTTDVDALIFDRKTGALALFELKSQDPFAYSRQERLRQRDYFYNASKQILACVQWLNRNGANALLTRLDAKLVKRLKVQKTYIFVLGRYLAHFFDGPEFDRRAAWATWPQVLRLLHEGSPITEDAHPIQSLYNKLTKDTPLTLSSFTFAVQQIPIAECTIYIYPDFQTYKNRPG